MSVPSLASAAFAYADRGRRVFPLGPKSKTPMTPRGVKDATTDCIAIGAWWRKWPNANIGCATGEPSGFWSLDIDGEDGEAALRQLEAAHGPLPRTVELITGRGRQVFFAYTAPLGNSVGRLGRGLDTRADGGYTILPPSIHPNGRPYSWSVDGHPTEVGLAIAPTWLLDALRPRGAAEPTPSDDWVALIQGGIDEPGRNNAVTRLAGHLLRRYIDPHVTLELCRLFNVSRCRPPLPDDDIHTIVNSICRRELQRRGQAFNERN